MSNEYPSTLKGGNLILLGKLILYGPLGPSIPLLLFCFVVFLVVITWLDFQ